MRGKGVGWIECYPTSHLNTTQSHAYEELKEKGGKKKKVYEYI